MTRNEAWSFLCEYTKNPNLRKHALAVEAAMRYYARKFQENVEIWGIVGLLHDFDYEAYPSLEEHPYKGREILTEQGYQEVIIEAIMAHAPHTGVPRDTLLKKTIFAVDELTGFIIAVALIKPSKKLQEVTAESVLKKMKEKSFARPVSREDLEKGAAELEISLEEHIRNVLNSLQLISKILGL